jgi:hypothetical protein
MAVTVFALLVTIPAFASGYGPAPFYKPATGAPSSQKGPSAQTIAAEQEARDASSDAYGSSCESETRSGKR